MTRLALLRHGHTAWNRAGRLQGRIDEPLDARAREHLAGLRLPDEFRHAALFSSPLVRAVETARLVAARSPAVAPELVEMAWGAWEGLRGTDLLADGNSGYRHVGQWGWDFRPPGGETPRMVWERVRPWLATLEGLAVAVTHVGVMRVLLARAVGWDFDRPEPFKVKRDRLYVIDISDDGVLAFRDAPLRLIEAGLP